MKKLLFAFVFILPLTLNAQNSPALEVHEVDSVAIPNGGDFFLKNFIQANLQIPYMARVAKINGTVFLSGVINEKGEISSVEILKSIRPDCDKEAIRVFSLFNAWKPAQKNGRPVAMKINYPISFKTTETIYFVNGEQIDYFDENYRPVKETESYSYILKTKMDTTKNQAIGNIHFFNKKELIATITCKKDSLRKYTPIYPDNLIDSTLKTYSVRYEQSNNTNYGDIITYFSDGTVLEKAHTEPNKAPFTYIKYYKNGMVREVSRYKDSDKKTVETAYWYPNGQIQQVINVKDTLFAPIGKNKMAPISPQKIMYIQNQSDSKGNHTVLSGNGEAIFKSYDSSSNIFTEKGMVKNYKKEGYWTGKTDKENSFSYRDFFEKGVLVKGVAYYSKGDSSVYAGEAEISPTFNGGIDGYTRFLQTNLSYPSDAQRQNVQGKVYLQFVVCTDGTLCDFEVLKSAGHPSLDKEAIRVIRKSSGLWTSGIQRGRKVRSRYTIPINFSLSR